MTRADDARARRDRDFAIARTRIAEERISRTGRLDLSELRIDAFPEEIVSLNHLEDLDCSWTQVSDLAPLAGLDGLATLHCSYTQVSDLAPLAGLDGLATLHCSRTQVSDLAPLAGLDGLATLHCSYTQVSDLAPLAGLDGLATLDCSGTQVSDLAPLAGLDGLATLDCAGTRVSDLAPLAGLDGLATLHCSYTQVSDLAPLAGLDGLATLNCSDTQVSDLAPLAGLDGLATLHCSRTQVSDLAPLTGLDGLATLHCSGCDLVALPIELVRNPFLTIIAEDARVPGLPFGILSTSYDDDCRPRLHAYHDDLARGGETVHETRLLLLGNGRVGKTQIARWLTGAAFDQHSKSTHGINIVSKAPTAGPRLQIWDFGGQDIYHGTHALFLGAPAVMLLVWAREFEKPGDDIHEGIRFRNYPLTYWADIAAHHRHRDSPVLIAQTRCDRKEDEERQFPLPAGSLRDCGYVAELRLSARTGRGGQSLGETLADAVAWLRDPKRSGMARIGASWLRAQRRLEAMRARDAARPAATRRHRLLTKQAFETIFRDEGGVGSAEAVLHYLDANGVVLYRPNFFPDRVVLDQAWALDAIYAVFDRERSYKVLRQDQGRFTRLKLEVLVWDGFTVADQELFIDMMRSCGICFRHRSIAGSEDAEYIAPDLLPEKARVAAEVAARWPDDRADAETTRRYPALHGGLIRGIMAAIGEMAGAEALYWRGGLCAYESTTRARVLIEEDLAEGAWQGAIRVRARDGDAAGLLRRIIEVIERAEHRLGMRPEVVEPMPVRRPGPAEDTELIFEPDARTNRPEAAAAMKPVVLVTAFDVETRAVLRFVRSPAPRRVHDTWVFEGTLGSRRVIVVEAGKGNAPAGAVATRLVDHYGPGIAAFVGVAGGIKDVSLGDVVVATKVYGYESGKESNDGFRPRPDLQTSSHDLVGRARILCQTSDWRAGLDPSHGADRAPTLFVGPIAAGESVVATNRGRIAGHLREHHGDALAVEMEGRGFLEAVHLSAGCKGVVVRGISDLLAGKAESDQEGWQPRAADAAAAVLFAMLAMDP